MNNYSLKAYERETTIRWDDADRIATVWTNEPKMLRKMDKLVAECPEEYTMTREEVIAGNRCAWYTVRAKLISFRKPVTGRKISEEQREKMNARLAEYREKQR